MIGIEHFKLTKLVKRFLDIIWYVLISASILWFITVMVIGYSIPADPAERTTDVTAFFGFKVYPSEFQAEDQVGADIQGHSELKVNNTTGLLAWYIAGFKAGIMGLIFLYGLLPMRKLFASLARGDSFAQENAGRIKKIGTILLGWHLVNPILQYLGGRVMLNDIEFNVQGIHLYPTFEFNVGGLLAGLAIIVLAGIIREAAAIQQDQALTI